MQGGGGQKAEVKGERNSQGDGKVVGGAALFIFSGSYNTNNGVKRGYSAFVWQRKSGDPPPDEKIGTGSARHGFRFIKTSK